MCLLAFAIAPNGEKPFVLASNRDEFFARPTQALHSWPSAQGPLIHAGRDEQDGGTWLGVNEHGRVAMLTNVRSGMPVPGAKSRGELTTGWLAGTHTAQEWFEQLVPSDYGGFNLIMGDLFDQTWFWCSNRDPADPHQPTATRLHVKALEPGVYGLSNAALDTPWQKTSALRDAVQSAVAGPKADVDLALHPGPLTEALASRWVDPNTPLPETGVSAQTELALASAFISIPSQNYGTRCSTVVQVGPSTCDGELHLQMDEWTHIPQALEAGEMASWSRSEHRRLESRLRATA